MKKQILSIALSAALLTAISGHVMANNNEQVTSGSIDLTNTPPGNINVTPFSIAPNSTDAGGGVWDAGTNVGFGGKEVYSNYNHTKYIHSSSCTIGTHESHSGDIAKGTTSYSSATGGLTEKTHAYWKVNWVPNVQKN